MIKYGIQARRGNGEIVFFCSGDGYGEKWCPNALSLAALYDTKKQAKQKLDKLSSQWAGLYFMTVFQNL